MKAVIDWHAVYDHCLDIADTLKDEVSYSQLSLEADS
jgi:dsDNA-binding SOS-regulon protein